MNLITVNFKKSLEFLLCTPSDKVPLHGKEFKPYQCKMYAVNILIRVVLEHTVFSKNTKNLIQIIETYMRGFK